MYKAIRYIGSKQKVLPFLEENILYVLKKDNDNREPTKFFEGFVGTGIVSQYISENYSNVEIQGGDISLYSKVLFNILNLGTVFNEPSEEYLKGIYTKLEVYANSNLYHKTLFKLYQLIDDFIEYQNNHIVEGDIFNEFSAGGKPKSFTESRNFFHAQTGKTIDTYRKFLKDNLQFGKITQDEVDILLYFILAYACKMANTTSVFGAFLKSPPKYAPFTRQFCESILEELNMIAFNHKHNAKFYHLGIVESLTEIEPQTLIYLDPPYSTRRYESNYHILNFIVDLDFNSSILKQGSKTGQANSVGENPFGKKKETETIFKQMIDLGVKKSEYLAISYNSDGLITQQWMEQYCKSQGYNLVTKTKEYKRFKSKTEVTNTTKLEEILWIIRK